MTNHTEKRRVGCPIEGCDYSGTVASVAGHVSGKKDAQHNWQRLGYKGANHFKRFEGKRETNSERTQVLHIADTHIGKKLGGYGSKQWPVDCAEGFTRAVETALSLNVDAVFHTGDLFHNDRHGIKQAEAVKCGLELMRLDAAGIPFYYIIGDHERAEGERWFRRFEELDVATHLSDEPVLIGNHIALYGSDYKRRDWWERTRWEPECPPTDRKSILALHQSLAPLSKPERAECSVREILRQTHKNSGFRFDVIALGQLHKQIDRRIDGCRVVCGGATERLGRSKNAFTPFVGMFEAMVDEEITYHGYTLV